MYSTDVCNLKRNYANKFRNSLQPRTLVKLEIAAGHVGALKKIFLSGREGLSGCWYEALLEIQGLPLHRTHFLAKGHEHGHVSSITFETRRYKLLFARGSKRYAHTLIRISSCRCPITSVSLGGEFLMFLQLSSTIIDQNGHGMIK